MTKLAIQHIRDCSEGIIQKVDSSVIPANSVQLAVNLDFDNILGQAKTRPGMAQIGSQITDNVSVIGLYSFIKSDGSAVKLAAVDDSSTATNCDIYKYSASWAKVSEDWTKSLKIRFLTFLDTVAAFNGTDATKTSADGTTWVSTAGNLDAANFPKFKYGLEFKARVYGAGVSSNPNRLYWSSGPTAGVISWTSGNGYVDVEPEEGTGVITGLAKVPGYILIFKNRSMKRWDTKSSDPESLITLGAPSQEAIVMARQSVFFFNSKGIFETTGSYPRKVSRKIQKIIDAIPASYHSSVSGWSEGENVFFSVGDLTIDGLSITNAIIKYNLDTQRWTLYKTPTEMKVWSRFIGTNGEELIMAGDDDGNVWDIFTSTYTLDGTTKIDWRIRYQPQELGSRGLIKSISKSVAYTLGAKNAVVNCRINEEGIFNSVGTILDEVQELSKVIKGRVFEFELMGSGQSTIIGLDFPELETTISYHE